MVKLTRAKTPEEVGVSSRVVDAFLTAIEQTDIGIHSFMVIRHGKVAAECYRAPFSADRPHTLYSVSKTFTATAIGIAEGEGLLSLNDLVKDFFPEYTKDVKDEKLNKLTVRHLITMSSGKNPSLLNDKSNGNWIEYFFKCPWYNEPGTEFRYVNENIYMLSAIINKVSGMCMRDYLQPRLFEPLGIDYPFWETDENGIEAGGWGLYVKTEDMAKLMLCYQNDGKFRNKQIIPKEFAKAAHQIQSDNSSNNDIDSNNGYGYCIWRCGAINGYRCDGMFSQFGIVFDDYDAIVAVNSGVASESAVRELIWKYFPNAFSKDLSPEDTLSNLKERLKNAVFEVPLPPSENESLQNFINERTIHFRKNILLNIAGFPMSVLPLAVTFMTTDKAGNIDNVKFTFTDNAVKMYWTEGDESNTVVAGLDGRFTYGEMRLGGIDYKVCCTALVNGKDGLVIQIRPIETIGKRVLDFKFRADGRVTMKPSSTPTIAEIADSLVDGAENMFKSAAFIKVLRKAAQLLPPVLEPTHRGKFVK